VWEPDSVSAEFSELGTFEDARVWLGRSRQNLDQTAEQLRMDAPNAFHALVAALRGFDNQTAASADDCAAALDSGAEVGTLWTFAADPSGKGLCVRIPRGGRVVSVGGLQLPGNVSIAGFTLRPSVVLPVLPARIPVTSVELIARERLLCTQSFPAQLAVDGMPPAYTPTPLSAIRGRRVFIDRPGAPDATATITVAASWLRAHHRDASLCVEVRDEQVKSCARLRFADGLDVGNGDFERSNVAAVRFTASIGALIDDADLNPREGPVFHHKIRRRLTVTLQQAMAGGQLAKASRTLVAGVLPNAFTFHHVGEAFVRVEAIYCRARGAAATNLTEHCVAAAHVAGESALERAFVVLEHKAAVGESGPPNTTGSGEWNSVGGAAVAPVVGGIAQFNQVCSRHGPQPLLRLRLRSLSPFSVTSPLANAGASPRIVANSAVILDMPRCRVGAATDDFASAANRSAPQRAVHPWRSPLVALSVAVHECPECLTQLLDAIAVAGPASQIARIAVHVSRSTTVPLSAFVAAVAASVLAPRASVLERRLDTQHGFALLHAHRANVEWLLGQQAAAADEDQWSHVVFVASNELPVRRGLAWSLSLAGPMSVTNVGVSPRTMSSSAHIVTGVTPVRGVVITAIHSDQRCSLAGGASAGTFAVTPWRPLSCVIESSNRRTVCPRVAFADSSPERSCDDTESWPGTFWPTLQRSPVDDPALLRVLQVQRLRHVRTGGPTALDMPFTVPTEPVPFEGTFLTRDDAEHFVEDFRRAFDEPAITAASGCVPPYPTSEVIFPAWLAAECRVRNGCRQVPVSEMLWCEANWTVTESWLRKTHCETEVPSHSRHSRRWQPVFAKRFSRDPRDPTRMLALRLIANRTFANEWCRA
jgi:hypothetical protein